MNESIKLLIVEDNADDVALALHEFRDFEVTHRVVSTSGDFAEAMNEEWDCAIVDHKLPQFNSTEARKILQASGRDLPMVILSGYLTEGDATKALDAGVADTVQKSNMARLVPVVLREVRGLAVRRMLAKLEAKLGAIESRLAEISGKIG